MAETVLISRSVLVFCVLVAAAGCSVTGHYPKKDPRQVGERVERLRREVAGSLEAPPVSDSGTFDRECYEDWQQKKSVKPKQNDPWKVDYSQFEFGMSMTIPVRRDDIKAVYDDLVANLGRRPGWKVGEGRNSSGVVTGVSGKKEGVRLYAWDTPDGKGGNVIEVELQTDCYRHPNA